MHIWNMPTDRTTSLPIPTYRLYRERSDESAAFWIHCETIPERTELHNWEIAPHRHESLFQLFHLTAGSGELTGAGDPRSLSGPCAMLIPPGASHGFRFARDVDGLVVTAVADRLDAPAKSDRGMGSFLSAIRIVPLEPANADASAFAAALEAIHREIASRRPGHDLILDALVMAAVVSLARAGGADDEDLAERDRGRLRRLETLIAAHFREQLPVSFYACRVGVSAAHLNRLTRRHRTASVTELIARRVMDAARRDLVFTPTPIQSIAYSLGFSDPAYFNRFFRSHAGATPGAFREAERRRMGG